MRQISGNLLLLAEAGAFDVIVHGCNCFNTMGAGIANQIRKLYPGAYAADCETKVGDESKLGTYTQYNTGKFVIVNAYTQYHYQVNPPPIDYDAVRSAFKEIAKDFSGLRIGYPKIGAGLAGGDWDKLSKIIDEELTAEDHAVVVFPSMQDK